MGAPTISTVEVNFVVFVCLNCLGHPARLTAQRTGVTSSRNLVLNTVPICHAFATFRVTIKFVDFVWLNVFPVIMDASEKLHRTLGEFKVNNKIHQICALTNASILDGSRQSVGYVQSKQLLRVVVHDGVKL